MARTNRAKPKRRVKPIGKPFSKVVRKKPALRVAARDGERVDAEPETMTEEQSEQQTAPPAVAAPEKDGLDVSKVVVDRDELRELRLTEAAANVFAQAKGEQALVEIRARKGGHLVHQINPYDLLFDDSNPRDFSTPEMLERVVTLARSIKAQGVKTPLDVFIKGNSLMVNGGETRWRATMHTLNFLDVAVERIPVVISHNQNDLDRTINKFVGNDQQRFKPIEAGKLFQQAVQLGGEPREIARRIGQTENYVRSRLALMGMPEWLKAKVSNNELRAEPAYNLWLRAGEDDETAKKLFADAAAFQQEQGSTRIMARHIEAASEPATIVKKNRVDLRQRLAALLGEVDRDAMQDAMGAKFTNALFKLAKL